MAAAGCSRLSTGDDHVNLPALRKATSVDYGYDAIRSARRIAIEWLWRSVVFCCGAAGSAGGTRREPR